MDTSNWLEDNTLDSQTVLDRKAGANKNGNGVACGVVGLGLPPRRGSAKES